MLDPIEQLCTAISYLHTAIEEVARNAKVDVHELLEASDCINARVLALRSGYRYHPRTLIGPRILHSQWSPTYGKARRPAYLRVVK